MNPPNAVSTIEALYFWFCAAVAVFGALSTVASRNPIRGAMGLLLTICALAALFLSLSAEFLAAVQLLVYAGAVVVLFLFVIMLLGPAAQPETDHRAFAPRAIGALGTLIVGVGAVACALFWNGSGKVPAFPPARAGLGSIESMSQEIFSNGVVPFELSSALFLVAIVGAVAVARGRQGEARIIPRLEPMNAANPIVSTRQGGSSSEGGAPRVSA